MRFFLIKVIIDAMKLFSLKKRLIHTVVIKAYIIKPGTVIYLLRYAVV